MNVQKSVRKRISTNSYVPETTHMSYNILISNEIVNNIIDDGINGIPEAQTRPSLDNTVIEQDVVIDPEERRLQVRAASLFQILQSFLDIRDTNPVHAVIIHDDSNDEMLRESFSRSTEEEQSKAQIETIYGDQKLDSLMKKIDHECHKLKLASQKQGTTEADG